MDGTKYYANGQNKNHGAPGSDFFSVEHWDAKRFHTGSANHYQLHKWAEHRTQNQEWEVDDEEDKGMRPVTELRELASKPAVLVIALVNPFIMGRDSRRAIIGVVVVWLLLMNDEI